MYEEMCHYIKLAMQNIPKPKESQREIANTIYG